MRKHIPTICLIAAPYIFVLLAVVFVAVNGGLTADAFLYILITFGVIVAAVQIPNIIYALVIFAKKEKYGRLFFLSFLCKICHIPFFIAMFILGALLSIMIIFTIPLIIIIVIIDYTFLFATSAYGILGIIREYKEKKLRLPQTILHIWLHLCFVLDIVSAIYLFSLSKKKKMTT